MYFNRQLRWASPSSNYYLYSPVVRKTPYRRYLYVLAAVMAVFMLATDVFMSRQFTLQLKASKGGKISKAVVEAEPSSKPSAPHSALAAAPKQEKNSSQKVQQILNSWGSSHTSQQWSVVVQGLDGDKTLANLNQNTTYDPASVFKLYFTYPLLQQYSIGYLSKHYVTVSGRGSVTMQNCLEQMIEISDNPCGVAIGNRMGWGKTTKLINDLGMTNTNLNNLNGMTTSAADINFYLQKLGSKTLLPADARQYLLSLMQKQKFRDGIPAGCAGCTVADKIGDLGSVRHDVGIVKYSGGSYTLAIMTNGAPYSQIAQLTSQIQAAISGSSTTR
jgi:beta-lactamase class A